MTRRPWLVVAGGGTAGHVLPALAVAAEVAGRGVPKDQVLFVGSRRGIEARLVPAAGFPVTLLPGRGIQRRLTVENAGAVLGLVRAGARALALLARRRPAVVLSVGGYASVPCALGAVVLRVPLVLAESNARAGAANRLVARFARASAVAFPGTGLPRAELTGNPVRTEVAALADETTRAHRRSSARAALGVDDDATFVAVFGGSLGARRVNDATFDAVVAWQGRRDLVVHHAVGERDWERAQEWRAAHDEREADGPRHTMVRYEERMDLVYAAADLAVCRAGATSIADLAAAGLPAVLIPLPSAAEDHQTANARAVVEAGAGVLVPDGELTGERLVAEVDSLLADRARLAAMGAAARGRARLDAAAAIADLLDRHAARPRPGAGATGS